MLERPEFVPAQELTGLDSTKLQVLAGKGRSLLQGPLVRPQNPAETPPSPAITTVTPAGDSEWARFSRAFREPVDTQANALPTAPSPLDILKKRLTESTDREEEFNFSTDELTTELNGLTLSNGTQITQANVAVEGDLLRIRGATQNGVFDVELGQNLNSPIGFSEVNSLYEPTQTGAHGTSIPNLDQAILTHINDQLPPSWEVGRVRLVGAIVKFYFKRGELIPLDPSAGGRTTERRYLSQQERLQAGQFIAEIVDSIRNSGRDSASADTTVAEFSDFLRSIPLQRGAQITTLNSQGNDKELFLNGAVNALKGNSGFEAVIKSSPTGELVVTHHVFRTGLIHRQLQFDSQVEALIPEFNQRLTKHINSHIGQFEPGWEVTSYLVDKGELKVIIGKKAAVSAPAASAPATTPSRLPAPQRPPEASTSTSTTPVAIPAAERSTQPQPLTEAEKADRLESLKRNLGGNLQSALAYYEAVLQNEKDPELLRAANENISLIKASLPPKESDTPVPADALAAVPEPVPAPTASSETPNSSAPKPPSPEVQDGDSVKNPGGIEYRIHLTDDGQIQLTNVQTGKSITRPDLSGFTRVEPSPEPTPEPRRSGPPPPRRRIQE